MLYRTTKALIKSYKKHDNTAGLKDVERKIDIFYVAGKLTDEEYADLTAMLPAEEPEEETGGE